MKKKIPVDDREASLGLCGSCAKRWGTEDWDGWFDDTIPPNKPIAWSSMFLEAACKYALAAGHTEMAYGALVRWVLDAAIPVVVETESATVEAKQLTAKSKKPVKQQKQDEVEKLRAELAKLELEAKAPMKQKEQTAILKQIMDLKTKIRLAK